MYISDDGDQILIDIVIRSSYDRSLRNTILHAWKKELEADW